MPTYFISAIDTDAGKTIATGLLAKAFIQQGYKTITIKIAQTGCERISNDILVHRKIMGTDLLPEDKAGRTCPYLFKLPASPHLAARLENVEIDTRQIANCIKQLEKEYEVVLVEGVGGLMVPLTEKELVIDFILEYKFPVILVTSSKLGSINHSLLSLEVCKNKEIDFVGVIYNHFPADDKHILEDSSKMIKAGLNKLYHNAIWDEIPILQDLNAGENHLILKEFSKHILKKREAS